MSSLRKTIILCVLVFAVGSFLEGTLYSTSARAEVLFSEDFEGTPPHPLLDTVDEAAATAVWSPTPPTGWSIDNSQMGTGGVTEFHGWVFWDKAAYISTSGDQNRSLFTSGSGTIALADGDEWDDLPNNGTVNTWLSTKPINVAGYDNLAVSFDSSWRVYGVTEASLEVSYDSGPKQELLHWTCVSSDPDYHPDAYSEQVSLPLSGTANNIVLTFGYYNAGNDWWWAFDNLQVTGTSSMVIVSPTEISVSEDPLSAPDTYEIVLGTAPTHSVEITATPSDAQIDLGSGAGTAITLTFTTGNWNDSQTVTVTAFDDDVYEGTLPHTSTISHISQSDDDTFVGIIIPSVTVEVYDDDKICGDWGYYPADLDEDCYVDLKDFALFASKWLDTP